MVFFRGHSIARSVRRRLKDNKDADCKDEFPVRSTFEVYRLRFGTDCKLPLAPLDVQTSNDQTATDRTSELTTVLYFIGLFLVFYFAGDLFQGTIGEFLTLPNANFGIRESFEFCSLS